LGRKVHPVGFRLGIIKDWQSRWFAERNYTEQLHEDIKLRALVAKRLANASISHIELERSAANQIEITLSTAKPGIVIGKGGQAVEVLRKEFETLTGKKVKLNINEIKQPELDAFLVAESIADQITRRVSYKRAMKQAIQRATRLGAKGVRIRLSGRLGGAEMARVVGEREGRVPLHTIRADIDYGQVHAHTTYGRVGVKVWIYRGDVIGTRPGEEPLGGEFGRGREGGSRPPRPEGRQGGEGQRGPRPAPAAQQGAPAPRAPRPPRPVEAPAPAPAAAATPIAPAAETAIQVSHEALPAPAAEATPSAPAAETAIQVSHEALPAPAATPAEQPAPPSMETSMPAAAPAEEPATPYVAVETQGDTATPATDLGIASEAPATAEAAGTGAGSLEASTENSAASEAGTPSADEAAQPGEES
jgi:small subunit ribosomal protein S3